MTDRKPKEYIKTGMPGFDKLFKHGIPKGSSVIIAGGTGSGKTNFCLQLLAHHAANNKRCTFMGFEESEERLFEHMEDFGWNPDELIKSGNLKLKRFLTSEIYYDKKNGDDVQAMMTKEIDPLLMELEPLAISDDAEYKPDFIVIDSLTAISSTFKGKEQSYRFYIERLFRFFEKIESTTFLITETQQIPEIFSPTGVEEFLADGVIVFYNFRRENIRETAIEVLKMRGEKHQKKIVAMKINEDGIKVYPDQEVFGAMEA
ncbi:MAG: AAA family ATPase [Thermoplasmatales archaeon]|nr:AAA family ATPase [Thermoplasmatales archaeon]